MKNTISCNDKPVVINMSKRSLLRKLPKNKKGKSILRSIPLYNKNINPIWFYIFYFLNKIFGTKCHPLPYSKKIIEQNNKLNKLMIDGMIKEARFLLLTLTLIIGIFFVGMFLSSSQNNYDLIIRINIVLFFTVLILITKILIHVIRTGTIHSSTPDYNKVCEIYYKKLDTTKEMINNEAVDPIDKKD